MHAGFGGHPNLKVADGAMPYSAGIRIEHPEILQDAMQMVLAPNILCIRVAPKSMSNKHAQAYVKPVNKVSA